MDFWQANRFLRQHYEANPMDLEYFKSVIAEHAHSPDLIERLFPYFDSRIDQQLKAIFKNCPETREHYVRVIRKIGNLNIEQAKAIMKELFGEYTRS